MNGRAIYKYYQQTLQRRPYLVQAIQAGSLMGAGDLISQTIIEKKSWEYKRSLKFASIGFFIGGPVLHTWYSILQKYVGSTGKTVAIKKVMLDQLLFAPCFLCVILTCVGITQEKCWDRIKKDLSANYFDILCTNYYIWPWVQIVNFYYVPLKYQVLVVQTVALFWNTYLAWKTNMKVLADTDDSHKNNSY